MACLCVDSDGMPSQLCRGCYSNNVTDVKDQKRDEARDRERIIKIVHSIHDRLSELIEHNNTESMHWYAKGFADGYEKAKEDY